jgi:Alanine racemase, N-terminal domain
MTFTLYVDGPRWRANTEAVLAGTAGLVPVIKGNGYGFGSAFLGAEAARLGVGVVAVGQAEEVSVVRAASGADVLVLTPLLTEVAGAPAPAPDDHVIWTVATAGGVRALAGHRVVVELLTSMERFGFAESELGALTEPLRDVRLEGFALHLPLARGDLPRVAEVEAALARLERARLIGPGGASSLWVSHLTQAELAEVAARHPGLEVRARVGTRLWLGDGGATQARGTVLAVHRLRRGQRYGYWQRRAPRAGHLVVVAGGTSHGIALQAPTPAAGLGQRVRTVGYGGLEALGRALSPFRVDGARRWFAEPPHMQVSMVWLPDGVSAPAVGSELDVDVRMTTSSFDRVVVTG